MIENGNVRATISSYNAANGTNFLLWDHGYNTDGLRDAAGTATGTTYTIPGDNTNPDGLNTLWTTVNGARTQIMASYEVIAFKSCYISLYEMSAGTLAAYKTYYLGIRDYLDAHPEKLFIVMSPPPFAVTDTSALADDRATTAGYARQFANWLKATTVDGFLAGSHPNIVCFDLFDLLANPSDAAVNANLQKTAYESDDPSHPNNAANAIIGPIFARFIIDAARAY